MSQKIDTEKTLALITECRQSGLTDREWCLEHGINLSTFYSWVRKLKKRTSLDIPPAMSTQEKNIRAIKKEPPEVVQVNVLSKTAVIREPAMMRDMSMGETTLEIRFADVCIRANNSTDSFMPTNLIQSLRGYLC